MRIVRYLNTLDYTSYASTISMMPIFGLLFYLPILVRSLHFFWKLDTHAFYQQLQRWAAVIQEYHDSSPWNGSQVSLPLSMCISQKTRWVGGTPTTKVTPVTIWYIHTPDLGHQMVMVMVMNDLLPPPVCNVNRPSHSEIKLFQNLTMKIHGQGHVCGQRSRWCLP